MEDVFEYSSLSTGIIFIQFSWSGDKFAVSTGDGIVFVFEMSTFMITNKFDVLPSPVVQLSWCYDGSCIYGAACSAGAIVNLDITSNQTQSIYANPSIPVTALACCRKQYGVVAGLADGRLIFPGRNTMHIRDIKAHNAMITSVCFHDAGLNVVTAGLDGLIRIWNVSTLVCESSIIVGFCFVSHICFSAQQDCIIASTTSNYDDNGTLVLVSLPDGDVIQKFTGFKTDRTLMKCGFTSMINEEYYVFSPSNDGSLMFWKLNQDGQDPVYIHQAHNKKFIAVGASPIKPYIVTGGGKDDGLIRVYKLHLSQHYLEDSSSFEDN